MLSEYAKEGVSAKERRITQDDIVVENEQTSNTMQSVICPVCLCVLGLPHWVCEGCDNAFCKDCLEEWWRQHPKTCIFRCPNPSFKVVKRSNTYQAILDLLKVKCPMCQAPTAISMLAAHDSSCPRKLVLCPHEGCEEQVFREELAKHVEGCQFRREKCVHCSKAFLVGIFDIHQQQCPERLLCCQNEGCKENVRARDFESHQNSCEFLKRECQWCSRALLRADFTEHSLHCGKKKIQCKWCKEFYLLEEEDHHNAQCPDKCTLCDLCAVEIKDEKLKEHRMECMFREMLVLRASQQRLALQNEKLKSRVGDLELELEESIRNRHEDTVNSLLRIKEEERKELERDLLRIRNSIASTRKCRSSELAEHQKKLHLSTSLCVLCQNIKKKLEDDLQPLLRMEEDAVLKLQEIQREETTSRKSIIRL